MPSHLSIGKKESSPADGGGEKKGEATEQQTNAATAEKTTVPDVQDPSKEKKVEEVDAVKAEVAVFEQAPPNQPQEPVAAVGEGKKPGRWQILNILCYCKNEYVVERGVYFSATITI